VSRESHHAHRLLIGLEGKSDEQLISFPRMSYVACICLLFQMLAKEKTEITATIHVQKLNHKLSIGEFLGVMEKETGT
jgi:hypothetical protein